MSFRVRVDMTGHKEAMEQLRRLGAAGPKVAKFVENKFADRVVVQAKAICPVDQPPQRGGELRDSIRKTRGIATAAGRTSISVIAGSPTVPYAEMQHEDLTLRHTVGQGKFIEIPFLREVVHVPGELIQEINREARIAG